MPLHVQDSCLAGQVAHYVVNGLLYPVNTLKPIF